MNLRDQITVLVPTSPIPSHPSTAVIERTIMNVREQLPESEIIIMMDGVRPEQEHRRADYEEYKRRLIHLCNDWTNVLPIVHEEFLHQAEMTRRALDLVKTPLLLFMEHDTFFTGPIDFPGIVKVILSGDANLVGFYCMLCPWIHPEHVHMMLENERTYYRGVPMIRTWQWSQRPHVASVDFYRKVMTYFSPESRTMIEDRIYGPVVTSRAMRGSAGWDEWRLMFYAPEGSTINRSHTVDGRYPDPKYDMKF